MPDSCLDDRLHHYVLQYHYRTADLCLLRIQPVVWLSVVEWVFPLDQVAFVYGLEDAELQLLVVEHELFDCFKGEDLDIDE